MSGYRQVYDDEHLSEISFPLGGIGAGSIGLGGRGDLRDWEIWNRPAKGQVLPFSFFALWCQREGEAPVARILERRYLPPYRTNGFGLPTSALAGMPRFASARFRGEYPFAWLDLTDPRVPLEAGLEAFNPLIPLQSDDSGLPVAIFRWRLRNRGDRPVAASVCGSLLNGVGLTAGPLRFNSRGNFGPGYGGNVNQPVEEGRRHGIRMTSRRYAKSEVAYGSMALVAAGDDATTWAHWPRFEHWWHPTRLFWDAFAARGRLEDGPQPSLSPSGSTDVGSVAVSVNVPAGGEIIVPCVIAWYFPNRDNYFDEFLAPQGQPAQTRIMQNHYADRFEDAYAAAAYALDNLERLRAGSIAFHDALYGSTLPPEVLEAVGSTASVLKTQTVLRLKEGDLHAFEGCHGDAGCCPMDCTHVWNYEQTMAYLFPDLEQAMRRTDLERNTRPSGEMAFRSRLPLSLPLWEFKPAADGQMGTILKLYREWLLSGDRALLQDLWPAARRALAWAWEGGVWDADADGVMEGEQHNTLDIEFHGPNAPMGLLYLAALRAGEKLANEMGDQEFAARCQQLYQSGRDRLDRELWNGEYFVQKYNAELVREHQVGEGCIATQLDGQAWAHLLGLGYLLPEEHVRQAAESIYRYNFKPDLSEHECHERTYALNDEAGLVVCEWPQGKRPRIPVTYASECWTGVEYFTAAQLMLEGAVEKGLEIVRAVRNRYDGRKRNPWDEEECGHHYARAMASYAVLLALSGFRCDASRGYLSFAPLWQPEDFRTLWSMGKAWGTYEQRLADGKLEVELSVLGGELELRELELCWPESAAPRQIALAAGQVSVGQSGRDLRIVWGEPKIVRAEQALTLALQPM